MKAMGTRGATAPGRLELVRAFVNTCDVESGEDTLSSPSALAEWLAERDLLVSARREHQSDLRRGLAVREALRSLLEAAARAARPELPLTSDGRAALVASASGTTGALGGLLSIASEAMATGTWDRLKACRAETCRWAFYDNSPHP